MKLSIIVPVYNTAKYLPYTLKSLTSQDYADVEFVCVDDCSTDDSWKILCEAAKQDGRFCLIRQEQNQGVGAARKVAAAASKGEYIMFLDGDDALAEDACGRLVNEIERQHVDILQFGVETVYLDKSLENPESSFKKYSVPENVTLEGDNLVDACFIEHKMLVNIWNKIYSGELARKVMDEYPEERLDMAQDQLTMFMLLFYARTCGTLQEKLYIYNYGGGVTGRKSFTLKRMQTLGAHGKVLKQIDLFIDRNKAWSRCEKARNAIRDTFAKDVIWKLLKEAPQLDAPKGFDQIAPFFNSSDFMGCLANCMSEWSISNEELVRRVYGSEIILKKKQSTKTVALMYRGKLDCKVEKWLDDLSDCLKQNGYYTVIVVDGNCTGVSESMKNAWCSLCPRENVSEGGIISNFCDIIKKNRVDSVLLFDGNSTTALLEILAAKLCEANVFTFANDLFYTDSGCGTLSEIENHIQLCFVQTLVDGIIVFNERDKMLWKQWNDNVRILGYPLPELVSPVEEKRAGKCILYYADAQNQRQILIVLKILKAILLEDPSVRLQLVWKTPNQKVKRWLDNETVEMHIENSVEQHYLSDVESYTVKEAMAYLCVANTEEKRLTFLDGLPIVFVCLDDETCSERAQYNQESEIESATRDILRILRGNDCGNKNWPSALQNSVVPWKSIFEECEVSDSNTVEEQFRSASETEMISILKKLRSMEGKLGQLGENNQKYIELKQYCADLTEGKNWLEEQWKNLTKETQELKSQREVLIAENKRYENMSKWKHICCLFKKQ